MNAVTDMKPVALATFSLVPQTLTEAMELAKLIADSELAPKDYRGKPGNVLIAVQMGQEVGLSPMAAIQGIAVINGKPSLYGDVGKAILLSRGFVIQEEDIEVIKKTGIGRCKITRPGHPPCERTFSIENAKVAGLWGKAGPWTQYPERQMAWRAFWFAARDIASDVLKGLHGVEEVIDQPARDITPLRTADAGAAMYPEQAFNDNLPIWAKHIEGGKKSADEIIAMVTSKGKLTEAQIAEIRAIKPKVVDAEEIITFDQVSKKITDAKDADALDTAADLIGKVANENERATLTEFYNVRKSDLKGTAE